MQKCGDTTYRQKCWKLDIIGFQHFYFKTWDIDNSNYLQVYKKGGYFTGGLIADFDTRYTTERGEPNVYLYCERTLYAFIGWREKDYVFTDKEYYGGYNSYVSPTSKKDTKSLPDNSNDSNGGSSNAFGNNNGTNGKTDNDLHNIAGNGIGNGNGIAAAASSGNSNNILVFVLLIVIIVILFFLLFILLKRKKDDDDDDQ